jgi:transposase
MMLPVGPATRIFLAAGATDLRKSFEGLSDLVSHTLAQDPLSGHLFVFVNRKKNRIKLLYADGSGLWLCAKRLHGGAPLPGPRPRNPEPCASWPRS